MELGWYFWALTGVVAFAWWYTKVENGTTWAVWTWKKIRQVWEWAWRRMMSHLGESAYTHKPRHGEEDD